MAAAVVVLHLPYAQSRVWEYVRARAAEGGVDVSASEFRYNLFGPSVTIRDLNLGVLDASRPRLARADQITIRLSLARLIRGAVAIEEARLDGVSVNLEADPERGGNWPIASLETADSRGVSIPDIAVLAIEGQGGSFRDGEGGVGLTLSPWTLSGSGSGGELDLGWVVQPGSRVSWRERTQEIGELALDATLGAEAVRIRSFSLDADPILLNLAGTVSDYEDPVLALDLDAAIDIGSALRFVGLPASATGSARVAVSLENRLDDLEITGDVASSDLSVGVPGSLSVVSTATWNRRLNRVSVASLELDSAHGRARLSGAVDLGDGESELGGRLDAVDLEVLSALLDLPVQLAGGVSGDLEGGWPGLEWRQVRGAARLNIESPATSPSSTAIPLSGVATITGARDAIDVALEPLRIPELQVRGGVRITAGQTLSGRLDLDSPDVGSLLVRAVQVSTDPPEIDLAALPRGSLNGTLELGGTFPDPDVRFVLATPSVSYGSFGDVRIESRGGYGSDVLNIEDAQIDWQGQRIEGAGSVDLSSAPRLDLTLAARDVSVRTISGLADVDQPVEGTLAADARVEGLWNAPQIQAGFSVSGLTAWSHDLGSVESLLSLDAGAVELTEIDWRLYPSGTVSGSARYGFDGTLLVDVVGDAVELSGLDIPGVEPVGGLFAFAIDLAGSLGDLGGTFLASASEASFGDLRLGEIALSGGLEGSRARIELVASDYNLTGRADAGLQMPYPISAEFTMTGLGLRPFSALTPGRNLDGLVTGRLSSDLNLADWMNASAALLLDEGEVSVDGAEFSIDLPAALRYEARRFWIDQLEVVAAGQRLRVAGDLPVEPQLTDGLLRVDGMLDLASVASLLPVSGPVVSAGAAEIDVVLSGSLFDVRPTALVGLRGVSVGLPGVAEPVTGLEADVSVADDLVTLDHLRAHWRDATLEAMGAAPFEVLRGGTASGRGGWVEAAVTGIRLDGLPGVPTGTEGTAGARVEAETTHLGIEALEARLSLDTADLRFNGLEFVQQDPLEVSVLGGRLRILPFRITGPETRLEAEGEMSLLDDRSVRAELSVDTDTLVFASASGEIASSGRIIGNASLSGTLASPELTGTARLEDAELLFAEPAIELVDLEATLTAAADVIALEGLSASMNGGTLRAAGAFGYDGMTLTTGTMDVEVDGVFLEAPDGLETFSNGRVALRSDGSLLEVGGQVEVVEGAYTRDIALDRLLVDYVRGSGEELPPAPDPFLSRIRYDIGIETIDPIIVENNVAQLEATANLRLVGSYYRPGLLGRVSLGEGGTVRIQENQFILDRGTVDFTSPNRIEPLVAVVARTEVGSEDITLQADGGGSAELTTTLSSSSGLSEPNIVSLLLTGRTLREVRGAELNVAQEQALSYLTGGVSGALSRGAERALGLSRVRIEPNVIANESDPGARLTIAQDITRALELIYSMNLRDSGDQIWIGEYDFDRQFVTRGIVQENNTYRVELQHELQLGGVSPEEGEGAGAAPQGRSVIREIVISPPEFEGRSLVSELAVESGSRYDFFRVRQGTLRLEEFLHDRGYLEARVRVRREDVGDGVRLLVEVRPGPVVEFDYSGADVGRDVSDRVREAWQGGGFEALRLRRATGQLRTSFLDDGYLGVEIDASVSTENDTKRVEVLVRPGSRYRRREVDFEGAASYESIRRALQNNGLWESIHSDPESVRDFLEQWYSSNGYLDARVASPRYELDAVRSRARLVFPVTEGPRYAVSRVRLEGNARVSQETLREGMPVPGPMTAEWLNLAERHLEERYWELGYNDVLIGRSQTPEPGESVEVSFVIQENERSVVREIEFTGNRATSTDLVRGQVDFETGEPLNWALLNASRRSIYETGAFSLVQIDANPLERSFGEGDADRAVRVRFDLEELPPYTLRYGGFYDNERGPGVIADLENRSLLGGARRLGVRTRFDGDLQEARAYLTQPALKTMPFATSLTAYLRTEDLPDQSHVRSRGVSLQQETQLPSRLLLSYGYRFEQTRTRVSDPLSPLPVETNLNIAPLTFSLSRDSRDDPFDASGGWFTSHAFEYAAPALGSDLSLLRYFGQVFRYFPLSEPTQVPMSGGLRKSRVVFAAGVRVGLVGGLGDTVAPGEKFFAGGGTTIRGFLEDRVGPLDPGGDPLGGDALFVLNNEIRFPLFSLLEGVGFADAGNVFSRVHDFDFSDLRSSAGMGLRLRTPYFLLRADYGFNLNPRPGERQGAFFFSIGQAF